MKQRYRRVDHMDKQALWLRYTYAMLTEIYTSRKESYKPQALFIFQILKRTFQTLKYTFQFLERKLFREFRTFFQGFGKFTLRSTCFKGVGGEKYKKGGHRLGIHLPASVWWNNGVVLKNRRQSIVLPTAKGWIADGNLKGCCRVLLSEKLFTINSNKIFP